MFTLNKTKQVLLKLFYVLYLLQIAHNNSHTHTERRVTSEKQFLLPDCVSAVDVRNTEFHHHFTRLVSHVCVSTVTDERNISDTLNSA